MDLRNLIAKRVKQAVKDANGGVNIAAAVNVGKDGSSTSVYRDDEVTIVEKDGETTVTRHRDEKKKEGKD